MIFMLRTTRNASCVIYNNFLDLNSRWGVPACADFTSTSSSSLCWRWTSVMRKHEPGPNFLFQLRGGVKYFHCSHLFPEHGLELIIQPVAVFKNSIVVHNHSFVFLKILNASVTSLPLASIKSNSSSGVRVSSSLLAWGFTALMSRFFVSISCRVTVQLRSLSPRSGRRRKNSSNLSSVKGVFLPTFMSDRS